MEILYSILIAFGGGVFGTLIGGTTSFIFTGLLGMVGIGVLLASGNDIILNNVAFGPLFGPHVAFVGSVAATAYAARLKKVEDGSDTTVPLFTTQEPSVLLIGGTFGVIGFFVNELWVTLGLKMDTIALTVLVCGIVCRLLFGKSGLTGVFDASEKRYNFTAKSMLFQSIWSFFISLVISFVVIKLQVNNIGFTIGAVSLIFLYFGLDFPITHHVLMVAGFAALVFNNIFIAAAFGVVACILGEFIQRTFNTNVDSHIDMPASVIAPLSFIILTIFG